MPELLRRNSRMVGPPGFEPGTSRDLSLVARQAGVLAARPRALEFRE